MARNPKYTALAVNAKVDAQAALLAGGFFDLYDGSQPATGDTAVTTQTRLARLTFGSPAFGAGVAGVATANPITGDPSAAASGRCTWLRLRKSDGTQVLDGSVGLTGCDLNLDVVDIVIGSTVDIDGFTMTEPRS